MSKIKSQYGLLARPYLNGSTQPEGERLVENFGYSVHDCQEIAGRKVHAVVEYDRPLYAFEVERYSLHPIDVPSKADLIQAVLTDYFTGGQWSSHDGEFGISDHGAEGIDAWGPRYGPCTIDDQPSAYDVAEAVVTAYLSGGSDPLAEFIRSV